MRYEQTICSSLPLDDSRTHLLAFLAQERFRSTSPGFLRSVTLERGSAIGQWTAVRIEGWFCRVAVEFLSDEGTTQVRLVWEINVWGQVGTKADMRAWGTLMKCCERAAQGQQITPLERSRAQKANVTGMSWRAAISVTPMLSGIPIGLGALSSNTTMGWTIIGISVLATVGVTLLFVAPRKPIFPLE